MNITTETKHMTLRELFDAVETHKAAMQDMLKVAAKNSIKQVLVSYNDGTLNMNVSADGTVRARKYNRSTTFNIASCTDYTYHPAVRSGGSASTHIESDTFSEQRWEIRLILEAENRLWRNSNGYERSHSWRF